MTARQMIIGAAMMLSVSTSAQNLQSFETSEKTEKAKEIELLELAGKLVGYGQKTKSALPLIQAVQIFRQLNVVENVSDTGTPSYEDKLLTDYKISKWQQGHS